MSLLRRATGGRYPQFNNYVSPLSQLYGQTQVTSSAGERVDEWTVYGIPTVLSCVSLIADSVASMPIRCFQVVNGKRVAVPLPEVIAMPDSESNTYELVHQMVSSMGLHGNSYVHIDRSLRSGDPIGLVPLHPYQMQVLPTGDQTGRKYLHLGNEIPADDLIHSRWFTPPQSLVGLSPLNQTRNTMGLALAMERHLGQFYGEGAMPSAVLETDQRLTRDAAQLFVDTFTSAHRRHRRPAVLSEGMKFRPIQTSAADAQMIETREQVIRDIARIFRVPAHLIGATGDSQTYQNVEQASLNFLTYTIHPWLRRIELGLSRVLPAGTDLAFDTSSLVRMDALTKARVATQLVTIGARTPNEVRALDGLEPYDGGDTFNQALPGAVTAGGAVPALGQGDESASPVMGVLD